MINNNYNFNKKPHFPFTYGDDVKNDGRRLSDYVANKLSEKKTRNYIVAVTMASIALGSQAAPVNGIPPEYGEAANEIVNQAAQNGAAGGGVPTVPPIGDIHGHIPNIPKQNPGTTRCYLPAMPIEQQQIIAAQQAGKIGGMSKARPTDPPSFYFPDKPGSMRGRALNTAMFTTAMGVVCLNAFWGEPVAVLMCSSGLIGVSYKIGKQVTIFIAQKILESNIK